MLLSPGASLLAVFAHPDDESVACGGLLARSALEAVQVSLLCLTRGGLGQVDDPARIQMGDTRTAELHAAARVLGIVNVTVLDHRNGFFPWIDRGVLEADIRAAIEHTAPTAVVTFDDDGLYWHPDHIVVHERTTAAVAAMGPAAPALYYVSMPKGAMRRAWQAAATEAVRSAATVEVPAVALGVEVDAYGLYTTPPTLRFDARDYAVQKLRAIRCHASQLQGDTLALMPEAAAGDALGIELYRRAEVGSPCETFVDLWCTRI